MSNPRVALRAISAAMALLLGSTLLPFAADARSRPPRITARAALVVDARDGHVLFRRAAHERRPIASTTKLMTALLTLEHLGLRRRLSATPYQPGPAESVIGLSAGERMAVKDLLRALLLPSANDAAVTLAKGVTGSIRKFVRQMNRRAHELGLAETHYANPIGLDEARNFSSAFDLSRLARRLLHNRTFASIVKLPKARLHTGARPRVVVNRNDLVARVPWVNGVKTGHTAGAGYVLVGYGTQRGVRLVSVVLGEPSEGTRDSDTLALLQYGFSFYRHVKVASTNQGIAKAHVRFYGDRTVSLVTPGIINVALRPGERLHTRIDAPKTLEGPIERGTRVGTMTVFSDDRRVRVQPLVTADRVPEAGFFRKAASHLGTVLLVALGLGAAALVVRRRARREKSGTHRHRVVT